MLDLNVCKSRLCTNLGVSHSPDYEYNIRALGFLAMYCRRCGATPPMLDNNSYHQIWQHWQTQLSQLTGRFCPACGQTSFKRFGASSTQQIRYQCKLCSRTFSARYPVHKAQANTVDRLQDILANPISDAPISLIQWARSTGTPFDRACQQLHQLALMEMWQQPLAHHIATSAFTLPYKGRNNRLWMLISTDMNSNKILHISSSLVPLSLSTEGRYQPGFDAPIPPIADVATAIELAHHREQYFLSRPQFDRCDFGEGTLGSKSMSHALPVLTAHTHFAVLKQLGHGGPNSVHCLSHEVFLRGACITQFADDVKQHQTALLYVVGETHPPAEHSQNRKLGWWQNEWHEYHDADGNTKAFTELCGSSPLTADAISLSSVNQAIHFICQSATHHDLHLLTAQRVNALIAGLTIVYNNA
ncbi:transposase [Photobacterium nomapromontoriensis]|uniref:transposase n=1 Tax=Photobacterium nomapromontoriensis TaxID=2910237 RepID=UPI003D0E5AAB